MAHAFNDLSLQCLAWAKREGATSAEIDISMDNGFEVSARLAQAETISYQRSKRLSMTVYVGQRSGSVSTSDFHADKVEALVKNAVRIARLAEEDPAAGIAEKHLLESPVPSCDIDFPWDITPEAAMQLAIECDRIGMSMDPRIKNSENASISTYRNQSIYANSHGFIGEYSDTYHSISSGLVAEAAGDMQRDYYYATVRDAADLPTIEFVAKEAAKRTIERLAPRAIPTQELSILMVPEIARSFFGHFISAIQGSALYRRSSFLLDQLGQPIFPEWLNIREEPHLAKGIGTAPFDGDGIVTYAKDFVTNGVLQQYAFSCYSARKMNAKSTANAGGLHNVIIKPGQQSFAELLKTFNTGLLVTEVMGQGVNIVTGDYSRGAAGFWVQDGEIQYPVDGVTIAGHLSQLYRNIRAISNDVDTRGNIRSPSIIVDGVMLAGK